MWGLPDSGSISLVRAWHTHILIRHSSYARVDHTRLGDGGVYNIHLSYFTAHVSFSSFRASTLALFPDSTSPSLESWSRKVEEGWMAGTKGRGSWSPFIHSSKFLRTISVSTAISQSGCFCPGLCMPNSSLLYLQQCLVVGEDLWWAVLVSRLAGQRSPWSA